MTTPTINEREASAGESVRWTLMDLRNAGFGRKLMGVAAIAVGSAVVFASGHAVEPTTAYYRPGGAAELAEVAGGYRALFTCSAHFIAKRDLADIQRIELVDTHGFKLPPPEIDEQRRLVMARGRDGKVAIAAHRQTLGCTLLPPDWRLSNVTDLPHVEYASAPDVSALAFPHGDKARITTSPGQNAWLDQAFDGKTYGKGTVTGAVVIVRGGEIVAERYGNGFGLHSGYRTWSTAKSITATLIAIAIKNDLLSLTSPAPIPQWQFGSDPRRAITLANLLHMSSGLASQGNNTNAIYFGGAAVAPAVTQTSLEATPGTRWKYANNDTLLSLRALRHALQDDQRYLRYPYDELFHRIGMYNTRMEVDHAGDFVGSSQVYTTARDLARFGLLYLNDGTWEGQQILPVGWTDFVARPAPSRPAVRNQVGYGAQFWLYGQLAGLPRGTYTSSGNKGQFATIIPEHDMVIVRTGVDPQGNRWSQPRFVVDALKHFELDRVN